MPVSEVMTQSTYGRNFSEAAVLRDGKEGRNEGDSEGSSVIVSCEGQKSCCVGGSLTFALLFHVSNLPAKPQNRARTLPQCPRGMLMHRRDISGLSQGFIMNKQTRPRCLSLKFAQINKNCNKNKLDADS